MSNHGCDRPECRERYRTLLADRHERRKAAIAAARHALGLDVDPADRVTPTTRRWRALPDELRDESGRLVWRPTSNHRADLLASFREEL